MELFYLRWNEALIVHDMMRHDLRKFTQAVDFIDHESYAASFYYCDGEDGVVSARELRFCALKIAEYAGIREISEKYIRDFAYNFMNVVDTDDDGFLDFDEYKLAIGAFAGINARVIMNTYDNNNDGHLTCDEIAEWRKQAPNVEEDFNACSFSDIARFMLNADTVAFR